MMKNWFVYAHYTRGVNGKPFYIGIGKLIGRERTIKSRNLEWKKIVKENKGFSAHILYRRLTKEAACKKEKGLIKKFKRLSEGGTLANITGGGQGNCDPSKEVRFKIGNANRGKKFSESHRLKLSLRRKGKEPWNKGRTGIYSDEVRQRISNTLKGNTPWNKGLKGLPGHPQTEKTKLKISQSLKGNHNRPKTRNNINHYGKNQTRKS